MLLLFALFLSSLFLLSRARVSAPSPPIECVQRFHAALAPWWHMADQGPLGAGVWWGERLTETRVAADNSSGSDCRELVLVIF